MGAGVVEVFDVDTEGVVGPPKVNPVETDVVADFPTGKHGVVGVDVEGVTGPKENPVATDVGTGVVEVDVDAEGVSGPPKVNPLSACVSSGAPKVNLLVGAGVVLKFVCAVAEVSSSSSLEFWFSNTCGGNFFGVSSSSSWNSTGSKLSHGVGAPAPKPEPR